MEDQTRFTRLPSERPACIVRQLDPFYLALSSHTGYEEEKPAEAASPPS